MSQHSDEAALIRDYLLGNLDEMRQEQVEERLLCDDAFAERLYAEQDDLIDDYAFNLLPEDKRESFEKNFTLTDERRKKILFAQTLESYVSRDDARQRNEDSTLSPRWKNLLPFVGEHKAWAATALATLLLLIFLTPVVVRRLNQNNQVPQSQNRANIERQIAELNKRPFDANIQAAPTLELSLQSTLLRDEGAMKKAVLTRDIKILNIKLGLPQVRYDSYRALVRTVEGSDLFAVDNLKPEAGASEILLKIPSEYLPTADYQIELKGIAADGRAADAARYNFRIMRQP